MAPALEMGLPGRGRRWVAGVRLRCRQSCRRSPPPSTHRQRWGGWKSVLGTEVVEKAHLGPDQHSPPARALWSQLSLGPQVQECPPPRGDVSPAWSCSPSGCHPKESVSFPPPVTPAPSAHVLLVVLQGPCPLLVPSLLPTPLPTSAPCPRGTAVSPAAPPNPFQGGPFPISPSPRFLLSSHLPLRFFGRRSGGPERGLSPVCSPCRAG